MLNKDDFFTRFVGTVPGEPIADIQQSIANPDIYFEMLSMDGLEEMHRYSKDVRFYEFLEIEPFEHLSKTRTYIEKLEQRMAGDPLEKTAMYWFIRRKTDDYLIGTAALVSLDYGRQSVEWGYGVDPELWGLGFINQIEEILKQYVFEVLELNRLHGTTMVTNQRTIASLLASGMEHEGTLRQFYCKDGVYIDAWEYAMLSEDYFTLKENLSSTSDEYSIQDVIDIISSILTEEVITSDSDMCTVMSWDSLNHMSIMIAVTEKTGVKLSPSEMVRANSVKEITSILAEKINK